MCGKGRVRKKFMGRETQSPGGGLMGGKQAVRMMGVMLQHL